MPRLSISRKLSYGGDFGSPLVAAARSSQGKKKKKTSRAGARRKTRTRRGRY